MPRSYEFNPKVRKKAEKYRHGKRFNFFLFTGLHLLVLTAIIATGFAGTLAAALPYPWHLQAGLYYAALFVIMAVVYFPFTFFFSHVYEAGFGLSSQSVGGWMTDYAKHRLLSFVIGLAAVLGLYFILRLEPWWAYALVAYLAASVFFNYVYPFVVTPMFYKLKSYRDAAHHKKIIQILHRTGVSDVKHVYVANESQRSVKANAFFAGFGSSKQVVLFDTLVNNFTRDEVETVIGHELAHYVNKDVWKDLFASFLKMIVAVFVIDRILRASGTIHSIEFLPLILLTYTVVDILAMPFINWYNRKQEKEADLFALNTVRKPRAQISSEKRLADIGLSELKPHPLKELWLYTHPNVLDRIKMCEDWMKSKGKRGA